MNIYVYIYIYVHIIANYMDMRIYNLIHIFIDVPLYTSSFPLHQETFGRGRSAAQRLLELAGFAQNGEGVVALPATRPRVQSVVRGAG